MENPNRLVVRSGIASDLAALGVGAGDVLLVHSSLKSLGWVCGGAPAVILALEDVLTRRGTLVMPTHSGDVSDPANWIAPPVPPDWWPAIRDEMPVFDRDLTPTRGMGAIPETFRKQRGTLRSSHPQASFAAWGSRKRRIVRGRQYDYCMNDSSPLGRLYRLDARVLLLGVGWESNTSFHLAEYRAEIPGRFMVKGGMPILAGGKRIWSTVDDIDFGGDDFPAIGADYEATGKVRRGKVGLADCRLFRQRELVDFAAAWMKKAPRR
jgi:aminoglycoside 3-N-acetyltransferase